MSHRVAGGWKNGSGSWLGAVLPAMAALTGCGGDGIDTTSIDQLTNHPSVVALVREGNAFCTGVLISPTRVLTAAHCIDGLAPAQVSIFFGTDVGSGQGRFVDVAKVAVVPDFDPLTLDDDLGVVTLSEEVSSQDIAPAQFVDQDVSAADIGSTLIFVGFGRGQSSQDLKTADDVTLRAVDEERLLYLWRGNEASLPTTIPEFAEGDCTNGAGSPTFLARNGALRLVGINSYSSADCEAFGVNGKVSTKFIDQSGDL